MAKATQLGKEHHALIQSLLSRGPLSEGEFHDVFAGVTGRNPATHQQLFSDVLSAINKELQYVQLELRGCRDQYDDGRVYYGVVNNSADEVAKLGTKYSVPQIKFFKAVIEAIIVDAANQGFINNIDVLNIHLDKQIQTSQHYQNSQSSIPSVLKNFSMSQKEKTLNDLIKDQWLFSTLNGKIGLGIRSFLDLRRWFHNHGIPSCDVCNEAAVKAITCPNEVCTVQMHEYCLKKRFSEQKIARVCPSCSTAWPLQNCDVKVVRRINVPQHNQVSSNDPSPRKRGRTCKTEPSDTVPSADPVRRKSTRIRKTEPVDTAPSQDPAAWKEAPWGAVPKKMRSSKAGIVDAGEAGYSRPMHCTDKSSHRLKSVHITISD